MATLYLTEPGSSLHKEYQRLRVVSHDKRPLMVVPLSRVTDVVVVGRINVTTAALFSLLEAGVGLTMLSRTGKLQGRLLPPTGKNLPLRQAQYRQAADPAFCLKLSQWLVKGKLRNHRSQARRMLRFSLPDPEQAAASPQPDWLAGRVSQITTSLKTIPTCSDIATLMGQEGQAAKAYFAIFRAALKKDLTFANRTRRPPKDPVNALLSLGYSLLTANMMTALEIVGLDPYCGFFHTNVYGRPALALDLMEEFRPVIVDSLVLTLVNKRMLKADDFKTDHQGVFLNRRGRTVFFRAYTDRLNTKIYHTPAQRAISYQKIFEVQARQIAKLIQETQETYKPFVTR